MEIKALEITTLPSYEVELLRDDSIVLCRFILDCRDSESQFQAGKTYALPLKLVRKLQSSGNCYFVEKIINNTQKGGIVENGE